MLKQLIKHFKTFNCYKAPEVKPSMNKHFVSRTAYLRKAGQETRDATSAPGNRYGVISKSSDIYSDGVRLSATIWQPDGKSESPNTMKQFPAILLCHGWGGIRDHLDSSYAPKFAAEGFICLTFDYRTWGDSDGVLLPNERMPVGHDNMVPENVNHTMNCKILKKVVDPEWHLQDIKSCLTFLLSLKCVDQDRIGILK